MKRMIFLMKTMMALGVLFLGCTLAQAQVSRTWVAGDGDDMNPCSYTGPCKTLAKAYLQTIAGGQINVINAAAVGTLKIGHAITIDASESFAGIQAINGLDGITRSAQTRGVVTARGMII